MKLIMNKESFKHFSKIMAASAKLGEDLFFECKLDSFTIKSVNDHRSMFFFTKFDKRFFEDYQLTEQIECKFKSKSAIIPFKSSANIEKNLQNLEFFVDKEKDSARFQLNLESSDVSMFDIQYINTNLQIDLDDDQEFEHYLMAKNKSLISLFGIFPNANDYCMMSVEADKIYCETYNFKQNEVRTKFIVKSDIFLEYKIGCKIQTTFIVKPMKTFLNSMDKNANVYFYFEDDNCPIHVVIRNNLYENKFIIASIEVDHELFGEHPTGSVHMPREIASTDLATSPSNEEANEEANHDANNEENGNEVGTSSSYSTNESVSLGTRKDRPVKNERYKSIYSSSAATPEPLKEFAMDDVNDHSTQNDPVSSRPMVGNSALLTPADDPISQRQKQNSQHISQHMSINSQHLSHLNSQHHNQQNSQQLSRPNSQHLNHKNSQLANQQNSQHHTRPKSQQQISRQTSQHPSQPPNSQQSNHNNLQNSRPMSQSHSRHMSQSHSQHHQISQHIDRPNSQMNGNASGQVESQEVQFDDFDDLDDDIDFDAAPITETNIDLPMMVGEPNGGSKIRTMAGETNGGSQIQTMAGETNGGSQIQTMAGETNGGSQIRTMADEDLSSLEMDYEDNLLAVNEETSIQNKKISFENFLNKMPPMSTSVRPVERQADEQFTDFMNKHRNLLP